MRKNLYCLLAVLVILVFAHRAKAEKETDPMALFEATCSQCHSLDVPRGERLTRDGWTAIVSRMKTNGCVITDADAKTIIDYLTKEFGK
jgi:mono/diheme cytochrome c family protein